MARKSSDIYKQLIDSNDLVRELDDIEAISQQISQHAEVLYQSWKNNQQQQQQQQDGGSGGSNGEVKRSAAAAKVNGNNSSSLPSPSASTSSSSLASPSRVAKASGEKLELLVSPAAAEVNGNLKDLVNSFVSTDRVKQAARLTIANTINHQRSRSGGGNNNGAAFRSPSPSASSSSPFSSRAVSPLRSPMLLQPPPQPSPSSSSTSSSSVSTTSDCDPHAKLSPMFRRPHDGSGTIPIPVQHVRSEGSLRSPMVLRTLRPAAATSTTPSGDSIRALHDAHVENMKRKFEEAKQRMNLMQRRFTSDFDDFRKPRTVARTKPSAPHPELTPQQRQHIQDRAAAVAAVQPMRRFANGGSVAERVMIFERRPVFGSDHHLAAVKESKKEQPNWRVNLPSEASSNRVNRPVGGNLSLSTTTAKVVREVPIATVPSVAAKTPTAKQPDVTDAAATTPKPVVVKVQPPEVKQLKQQPQQQQQPQIQRKDLSKLGSSTTTPSKAIHAKKQEPKATTTTTPTTPSSKPSKPVQQKVLPRFHFPNGNPSSLNPYGDGNLDRFAEEFRKHKNASVTVEQLGKILKNLGYATCWKAMVFSLCVGRVLSAPNAKADKQQELLGLSKFSDFWRRMTSTFHDEASQFVYVVTGASALAEGGGKPRNHFVPEDLVAMIQDVVDSHPGLGFLKEATEFHSRYVHTVIARIFYEANRSWSGCLTARELRRSNFLSTLRLLDEEEDINAITSFFSYEHFYVIYCKFWELDKDHDLFIDREDLSRHNDHAISTRMIDRVFSGTVTRGPAQKEGKMSYTEFVWFLLAEEDKRHPTSIEYWFRCMDLDGDGYLSMYELEYFYEEQLQRMEQLGIETLPFEDCLCQMLDMIGPKLTSMISLSDLRQCPMTPIFFDTFFNLEKYLDHEQRDPFASQRDVDEDGNEMSDWDRFAAEEYELLVAEEGNGEGVMDELCYDDEAEAEGQDPEVLMEQALDNDLSSATRQDHQRRSST